MSSYYVSISVQTKSFLRCALKLNWLFHNAMKLHLVDFGSAYNIIFFSIFT